MCVTISILMVLRAICLRTSIVLSTGTADDPAPPDDDDL